VFKDARRLLVWKGEQKALAEQFRVAIQQGWGEEQQQAALLSLFESIIFQEVGGDPFKSVLMHFCAVLGINEELLRLRPGNNYLYMLAGIVYYVRVLAVEVLLPSAERDSQDGHSKKRFLKKRRQFLADSLYSAMGKLLSLLVYSKSLIMSHSNAGAVFWSRDRQVMTYKGKAIPLDRFKSFVQDLVTQAEEQLWYEVLNIKKEERFAIALN